MPIYTFMQNMKNVVLKLSQTQIWFSYRTLLYITEELPNIRGLYQLKEIYLRKLIYVDSRG